MNMSLAGKFIRSPVMVLSSFFDQFSSSTPSDGGSFGSLWRTVRGTGQASWRLSVIALGWLLAITAMISMIVFFSATKGQSRDQAKDRIKRILIIAFFSGSLLGIIGVVTSVI